MHPIIERILVGSPYKNTLSKHAKGVDRTLGVATIAAAALLGLGISSPLASSEDLFGLTGSFTILSAIFELMKLGQGSYGLGIAVVFVGLPFLNIATAFDFWYKHPLDSDKFDRFYRRVNACARLWFVIFIAAGFFIYTVNSSSGGGLYLPIYYLLASIILQKFVLTRMSRMAAVVQFIEDDGD
ncbi:hypothetical protein [Sneathiella glossodoripedis]|uniref:hypothetical protein n=1 Tax=Sneathiella glossodoripedis TaxID=418853 RepID=UPI00046E9123|nr:hypothetical protein [Sneathiella glossodoripedis]